MQSMKFIAFLTLLTPVNCMVLKSLSARSLAAAGVPDPHCKTGIISMKGVGIPQSCCAGYCGECNDYPTCESVRGQDSKNACCASKVYAMRCGGGNAPANVCLEKCSRAIPPCIMDADEIVIATPNSNAADDCTKAVSDWHVKAKNAEEAGRKAGENALEGNDVGKTTTEVPATKPTCTEAISLSFNDQPHGKCPSGWTCAGSDMKVCWLGGHNGNCHDGSLGGSSDNPSDPKWFYGGNDQDTGEAKSQSFILPAGISSMTVLRAGMSDWHHKKGSGIFVKRKSDDTTLCSANKNVAGWKFVEDASCSGLASHEGETVYILAKNAAKGGWGKLFFDRIRFVGTHGQIVLGSSIPCPA